MKNRKKKNTILTIALIVAYVLALIIAVYVYFNLDEFTQKYVAFINILGWFCALMITISLRFSEQSAVLVDEIHEIEKLILQQEHNVELEKLRKNKS